MRAPLYETLAKECQEERRRLEAMLENIEAEEIDHIANLDAALDIIATIGERFAKCSPEQQRAILLQMVERVIIHRGGRIKTIEWKPPFCYLYQLSQDTEEQQTRKSARKPKVIGKNNGSTQLSVLAPGELLSTQTIQHQTHYPASMSARMKSWFGCMLIMLPQPP
jgi:hypothetical protein